MACLNGSQLKILLYVIRRTFGFKKEKDNISLSQMLNGIVKRDGTPLDYGVGISDKKTLLKSLHDLEKLNLIERIQKKSTKTGKAKSY